MRVSRGRNQFTKAALGRGLDMARKKGIPRVDVELPGGSRLVFHITSNKQGTAAKAAEVTNEWDEEYGANQAEVRLPAAK